MTKILHLLDDTTPGGVMRVLDHLRTAPALARTGEHRLAIMPRKGWIAPRLDATILVSHLSVSWRRLPWFIELRARNAGTPLVHVEHSYTSGFVTHNVPRPDRLETLLATACSLFDRVVAVSEAQAHWLVRRQIADPATLRVIPSAVRLAPFLELPAPGGPVRVVGAFGRLEPQKGFDVLIAAMRAARRPGLSLAVFGEGAERARLEALAAGDSRIRFHGRTDDPAAAMATVDAVAMPSRWEAFGLVALEARAAGRPVLAAPVDGLADHVAAGALPVRGGVRGWSEALDGLAAPDRGAARASRAEAAGAEARFAAGWASLVAELAAPRESLSAA